MKRDFIWIGAAALALGGAMIAQPSAAQSGGKKASGNVSAQAVGRGKELFQKKCFVCHYATSDAKKIGPGLQGLNKRGTFTVNNSKVTDESVKAWIENGDSLMPPFKDALTPEQIKDLVRYVRTL